MANDLQRLARWYSKEIIHIHLALVLVCVVKLRPVAYHFGLVVDDQFARTIQSNLQILYVGTELGQKISGQRCVDNFKHLSSIIGTVACRM